MKCVLLVDDHDLVRSLLAIVLEQYTNFKESVQAGSLAEARRVQTTSVGKADLAIVDLDLPNGDGFALIKEMRRDDAHFPILALSARQDARHRARALEMGANEVFSTATSYREIIAMVRRLGDS